MKGFRKMDEMEKYISFKCVFWTYGYMVAFLVVWVAIDLFNKVSASVPLFLFVTQMLVQNVIRFTLERQMDGKNE
ncbi:hypothetical protein [Desulfitobacterium metallireducens]|uniref:Uncharacterized protein n=1 Tax=Desulfitobacterium metallireducens DSM 15288 TaxID=871968 RepID=W0E5U6_9FIRM|nr:hypothetical protein [Desulfitobacterium metallireducens]AHF06215.1 hypothetical protein DESME_03460 [Desulfitobacterium metallireducens DSM 15288]